LLLMLLMLLLPLLLLMLMLLLLLLLGLADSIFGLVSVSICRHTRLCCHGFLPIFSSCFLGLVPLLVLLVEAHSCVLWSPLQYSA